MRRWMATALIAGASLAAGGCGGAAESAEAAPAAASTPGKKKKIDLVVVNRTGVALDQVGAQFTGARVSFDEMDKGETEKVTLPEGSEPRSITLSWVPKGSRNRTSTTLSAPANPGTIVVTIDASHRATLTTR